MHEIAISFGVISSFALFIGGKRDDILVQWGYFKGDNLAEDLKETELSVIGNETKKKYVFNDGDDFLSII